MIGPGGKLARNSRCALRQDDKMMTTIMIKINKLLLIIVCKYISTKITTHWTENTAKDHTC